VGFAFSSKTFGWFQEKLFAMANAIKKAMVISTFMFLKF
jgi:hypothetical protein